MNNNKQIWSWGADSFVTEKNITACSLPSYYDAALPEDMYIQSGVSWGVGYIKDYKTLSEISAGFVYSNKEKLQLFPTESFKKILPNQVYNTVEQIDITKPFSLSSFEYDSSMRIVKKRNLKYAPKDVLSADEFKITFDSNNNAVVNSGASPLFTYEDLTIVRYKEENGYSIFVLPEFPFVSYTISDPIGGTFKVDKLRGFVYALGDIDSITITYTASLLFAASNKYPFSDKFITNKITADSGEIIKLSSSISK